MTFMFEDMETGEVFFVEVDEEIAAKEVAEKIANKYFKEPKFIDKVTTAEAEMMGYDTY